jgi:hypothetical protein
MCIICIDFDRQRLTTREARRALGEMTDTIGERHAREIEQKLAEAEAAEAMAASPPDPRALRNP